MREMDDENPDRVVGFAALGVVEPLVAALTELGYEEPTAIQRAAIPPLLEGRDVLGQAATGTGKTAAFALPAIQRVAAERAAGARPVRALVLVPTRELAMQVAEAVGKYGAPLGVRVAPIYGGQSLALQVRALRRGIDIVVATPGRAIDHLARKTLNFDAVEVVVLDEADEMLDMGFAEELEAIMSATPPGRQTALFSATMAPRIVAIAQRHMRDPVRLTVAADVPALGDAPRVREVAYAVPRAFKPAALLRVLEIEDGVSAIAFCRTRLEVDEITEALLARRYEAAALHGGLSQEQRDRVLRKFRDGETSVLVATDVAARGLDIDRVTHVINVEVPSSPDAYVHRIGRTGRAGRTGTAITLADPREFRSVQNIERETKRTIAFEDLPSVSRLRDERVARARTALEGTLDSIDLARFRQAARALAEERDPIDVIAAALASAVAVREAAVPDVDIPPVAPPPSRKPLREKVAFEKRFEKRPFEQRTIEKRTVEKRVFEARPAPEVETAARRAPIAQKPRAPENEAALPRDIDTAELAAVVSDEVARPTPRLKLKTREKPLPSDPPVSAPAGPPKFLKRRTNSDIRFARLFVGVGRNGGVRPADLTGAIANEANLTSREIGHIDVAGDFSIVEVPEDAIERVIRALRRTTIRGVKAEVRRDRMRVVPKVRKP
jgi:ATP-dependent RNA helicase DeaD